MSLSIASSVTVISGQFFGDPIHCDIVSLSYYSRIRELTVLLLQQRDEEFNTDDSADEDVVNNYCYMFATLNTPPDFKVIVLIIIDVFGLF